MCKSVNMFLVRSKLWQHICDHNSFYYKKTTHIWVKMPRKNNGLFNVINLLFLADYYGQLRLR